MIYYIFIFIFLLIRPQILLLQKRSQILNIDVSIIINNLSVILLFILHLFWTLPLFSLKIIEISIEFKFIFDIYEKNMLMFMSRLYTFN